MPSSLQSDLRTLAQFADIPKEVAYQNNALVYQFRLTMKGDTWLGVIKAFKGDDYRVAFVGSGSLVGVMRKMAATTFDGDLEWRYDAYPPKNPPATLQLIF